MAYSKDYFDIQLQFVNRLSQLTGKKTKDLLLDYTSFYKTFRIPGWSFSPRKKEWVDFLKTLKNQSILEGTYHYYLKRLAEDKKTHSKEDNFGCFSYEIDEKRDGIMIHFTNKDDPNPGALSKERMEVRKDELTKMFTQIKQSYPSVKKVFGFSWLYNIESYKRLFPPEYINRSEVISDWLKSSALWGQFLNSAGEIKENLMKKFLDQVQRSQSVEELKNSFPYPVIKIEGDIKYFYEFYRKQNYNFTSSSLA